MNPHGFLLLFLIWSTADHQAAEPGEVRARSYAAAEQYVRAGLQPHQRVQLGECKPVQHMEAGR